MNKVWIRNNLDRLATGLDRQCPMENTREFEPTYEFYDSLFKTAELGPVFQKMSSHIGLLIIPEIEVVGDSEIPRLDLQSGKRFFDKVIDSAGDYSSKTFYGKIRIGASYFRRVHSLGHIIAHELSHHYLHQTRMDSESGYEREMLTDLTAIYLGFGKLMLNSAVDEEMKSVGKPIYISKQGDAYLGYPLLAYSYYLCQQKRKVKDKSIYEYLKDPCASMVRAFAFHQNKKSTFWTSMLEVLGFYPKQPDAEPDTEGTHIFNEAWRLDERRYRILNCIGCGTKIKIPKTEKLLKVRCPKCKKEFQVGIRYK